MPTVGEIYGPMVEARHDPAKLEALLRSAGHYISRNYPDKYPSDEDGYQAARRNLDYYCQYYDPKTADETKQAMGMSASWRPPG